MAEATVFERIIRGEIPCHRVYEDDRVIAFLDVAPQSRGHLLVVPKEAKATLGELSDESAAALGRALPRLARALARAVGTPHLNVLQNNGTPAGQTVHHVHFHLIPRFGPAGAAGSGLQVAWRPGALGAREGAETAAAIAEEAARDSGA